MKYVVFYKCGAFYHVYNDDAFILNYLFNYNIKDNCVGFPLISLDKIITKLEELEINYQDINNDIINFNNDNYYKYLNYGKNNNKLNNYFNTITNKLFILEEQQIDNIINNINQLIEL